MDAMTSPGVKEMLFGLSEVILFVFATPVGLAIFGTALVCALSFRAYNAIRTRSLLVAGAGGEMKAGDAFAVLFEEAGKTGAWVLTNLPALVAVVLVFTAIVGVGESLRKVDAVLENARKVEELSKTLRNLDRRYRVADARVLDQKGGVTTVEFTMFAGGDPTKPAKTQVVSIKGSDIYFDAIVCNFSYTDIENGSRINLAIPYRVFSESVAQKDGVALEVLDGRGVPFHFIRDAESLYGLEKTTFDERVLELVRLMASDEESRKAGIVRSVYGGAVHRVVRPGDRLQIWIEQSGGLTIKDASSF